MKTTLDKATRDELINRIGNLNESSRAEWGKMNVSQMLRHCTAWEELMSGRQKLKRAFVGRIFGRMALRRILKDETPLRRNTPTSPEFKITTDGGNVLSWSADGREILVATLSGHIVSYPVSTTGGNFSAGAPQVLIRNVGFDGLFASATRDHSRILVRVPKDADKDRGEIRLLFGWARGLGGSR